MTDRGLSTFAIAAALAVSFIALAVAIGQRPPTAKEIAHEINGGDAFAYLSADAGDLRNTAGEVRLWINATDVMSGMAIFISPWEAGRNYDDPRYWSLAKQKIGLPVVYKGAVLLGRALDRGDYAVEISARNGTFVERLTIERTMQSIELVRADTGATLYRR